MTPLEAIAILVAGMAAGGINTLVGSGTLITFPTLLAVGYSPVVANVTNTVGLVPGSVAGAWGYRRELEGQGTRALRLAIMSVTGGITGAVLLLVLPASYFKAIVPFFIVIALIAIVLQPRLSERLAERRESAPPHGGPWTAVAVFAAGVYGGYFGAAQGILLIAILSLSLPEPLQRVNALKNVLAALVNGVAGIFFMFAADVDWAAAGLIAAGATAGGLLAGHYGRRLPAPVLRGIIVVVGVFAIVRLVA
jgi:uncharacterized protein